jgi:hypothetical protein
MGRPPLGERAMTPAEKQRRYRERKFGNKPAVTKASAATAKLEARIRELEAELARERALPPPSKTERQELAAYKRQIKSEVRRELEAQFEQRVDAGARELLDYNIKRWLDQFRAAERRIKDFSEKLNRLTPIMPRKLFRQLQAAAHSDRSGSNELAVHFNNNKEVIEAALCGSEAERRKWELTPPPMSRAELDAAREKVRAEKSARAKRAAATRAARKAAKP